MYNRRGVGLGLLFATNSIECPLIKKLLTVFLCTLRIGRRQSAFDNQRDVVDDLAVKKCVSSLSVIVVGVVFSALGFILPANAQVNVTQFHNHVTRDGLYVD